MICGGVERKEHGKVTFLIGKIPDFLGSEGGRRCRKPIEACGTLWGVIPDPHDSIGAHGRPWKAVGGCGTGKDSS
jgi:hypothetical protein